MNAITKRTRKQTFLKLVAEDLRLAKSIRENGYKIGENLWKIHDDDLWDVEYETWTAFLDVHSMAMFEKSSGHCQQLMNAVTIRKKLPDQFLTSKTELPPSAVLELRRLAPRVQGNVKNEADYSKIRKQDVARVIKAAGPDPSVRDIRAAVDEELGIDRKAEAAKAKERRETESKIDLDDYLRRIKGTSEGWQQVLEAVPVEAWEDYADQVDEAAKALESLLDFLRS